MSTYINVNLVVVMLALMSATIIFTKLSDYYGYHQYHLYVEYEQIIEVKSGYFCKAVDKKHIEADDFIRLKHTDFNKGTNFINDKIQQLVVGYVDGCSLQTEKFIIKSLTKID